MHNWMPRRVTQQLIHVRHYNTKQMQRGEQYEIDGYGADSNSLATMSFCDAAAADSSSILLPDSGTGAASESGLATSVFGMSWLASVDGGCDWFCCGRSGSFSMFANSNSWSKNNHLNIHPRVVMFAYQNHDSQLHYLKREVNVNVLTLDTCSLS